MVIQFCLDTIEFQCRREVHEHQSHVYHCMNFVQSSNSHKGLSCIEILLYLGMTVGAQHSIKIQCASCCSVVPK